MSLEYSITPFAMMRHVLLNSENILCLRGDRYKRLTRALNSNMTTQNANVCPVVGSSNTVLPLNHPSYDPSTLQACPVTNATTEHHQNLVPHPNTNGDSDANACPVLHPETSSVKESAPTDAVCPVVGPVSSTLPPHHPTVTEGEVCPVTNATLKHHLGTVSVHPNVGNAPPTATCPVVGKKVTDIPHPSAAVCPVVGTTSTVLPPNHPATDSAEKCPVTLATADNHKRVFEQHPAVPNGSSAADCPVLSKNEKTREPQVCPVVGTSNTILPPNHPPAKAGEVCPVTNATTEHHIGVVQQHPATSGQNDAAMVCPVYDMCPSNLNLILRSLVNQPMAPSRHW